MIGDCSSEVTVLEYMPNVQHFLVSVLISCPQNTQKSEGGKTVLKSCTDASIDGWVVSGGVRGKSIERLFFVWTPPQVFAK